MKKNNEKLKANGRFPYLPKRMSGEWHVANTLVRMKIRYVPEYIIENLKHDSCSYRVADFYLPKEKIVIEHCGRWAKDKERYREKRRVYLENNIKYIFIYPQQLNNLDWALKKEIDWVVENSRVKDPEKDLL